MADTTPEKAPAAAPADEVKTPENKPATVDATPVEAKAAPAVEAPVATPAPQAPAAKPRAAAKKPAKAPAKKAVAKKAPVKKAAAKPTAVKPTAVKPAAKVAAKPAAKPKPAVAKAAPKPKAKPAPKAAAKPKAASKPAPKAAAFMFETPDFKAWAAMLPEFPGVDGKFADMSALFDGPLFDPALTDSVMSAGTEMSETMNKAATELGEFVEKTVARASNRRLDRMTAFADCASFDEVWQLQSDVLSAQIEESVAEMEMASEFVMEYSARTMESMARCMEHSMATMTKAGFRFPTACG